MCLGCLWSRQAPAWAFILSALGLFIYQSLDAIDGKQARRTNSSSALGELFDHGCDAVSTGETSARRKRASCSFLPFETLSHKWGVLVFLLTNVNYFDMPLFGPDQKLSFDSAQHQKDNCGVSVGSGQRALGNHECSELSGVFCVLSSRGP